MSISVIYTWEIEAIKALIEAGMSFDDAHRIVCEGDGDGDGDGPVEDKNYRPELEEKNG